MKLKTTRATLLPALARVQGIVERKGNVPILANVLLSTKDGTLTIVGTDMEIAATVTVAAEGAAPGTCTAPADTLYEVVRRLDKGAEITLSHKDETLTLKAGRYSTRLPTLPVDDFPAMTTGVMPHRFQVAAPVLAALLERTEFAMSTEATRYYLNGIYLHAIDGNLRSVSTDGHRLARADAPLPEGAAEMPGIIIPSKMVGELAKLLDGEAGAVSVAVSDTRIQVSTGTVSITGKLIDGTFPEYGRVIPQNNDNVLRVPTREFAAAVSRVATVSDDKALAVKLALAHGTLTLSVTSADHGQATEEMDVDYTGEPLEIGFQARYLDSITANLGATTEIRLSDANAPAVVVDPENPTALFVCMPIRV